MLDTLGDGRVANLRDVALFEIGDVALLATLGDGTVATLRDVASFEIAGCSRRAVGMFVSVLSDTLVC